MDFKFPCSNIGKETIYNIIVLAFTSWYPYFVCFQFFFFCWFCFWWLFILFLTIFFSSFLFGFFSSIFNWVLHWHRVETKPIILDPQQLLEFLSNGIDFTFLRDCNCDPLVGLDTYNFVLSVMEWNQLFTVKSLVLININKVLTLILSLSINLAIFEEEHQHLFTDIDLLEFEMILVRL